MGHVFGVLLIGTQDASEDDHLRDAGQTADMIEQADRCQQPQDSGGSGLEDDPDLLGLSRPPDDQFMEPHQAPSHAVHGNRPDSHQRPSALLSEPAPTAEQAQQLLGCQKAASQQLHHERIAGAQQVHHSHKVSLQTLPGRVVPQHDGYQSLNGHGPFDPSKFLRKFTGINLGGKTLEDPADAALSNVAVCLLLLCQWACVTSAVHSWGVWFYVWYQVCACSCNTVASSLFQRRVLSHMPVQVVDTLQSSAPVKALHLAGARPFGCAWFE